MPQVKTIARPGDERVGLRSSSHMGTCAPRRSKAQAGKVPLRKPGAALFLLVAVSD